MKNLALRFECHGQVEANFGAEGHSWTFSLNEADQILATNGTQLVRTAHMLDGDEKEGWTLESASGKCISVIDLMDDAIVLAYREGAIVSFNVLTSEETEMGQVDSGIDSFELSPDQEVFLVVSRSGNVILMTRDFDPLLECDLHAEVEGHFVSVGWGKKQTQFHGSLGKQAALAEAASIKPISPNDDQASRAAWREDGQFFVVSYVTRSDDDNPQERRLRIFDRNGSVISQSEPISGLQWNLSWKPSGSLITSSIAADDKLEVIFIEKNGLQHGAFGVPCQADAIIKQICWHKDSDALLVSRYSPENDLYHVDIFASTNYKWDLKQSFVLGHDVVQIQWDICRSLRFFVFFGSGAYHIYQMSWEICHGQQNEAVDPAIVSVISGNSVRMTSFRTAVIPPPMCAFKLDLSHPVQQVLYAPNHALGFTDSSTVIGILFSRNKLAIFATCGDEDSTSNKPVSGCGVGFANPNGGIRKIGMAEFEIEDSGQLTNICWLQDDILISCYCSNSSPILIMWKLEKDLESYKLLKLDTIVLKTWPFFITSNPVGSVASLQYIDGSIMKFVTSKKELISWEEGGIPLRHERVFLKTQVILLDEDKHFIIGLTDNHKLYSNGKEILSSVSSFHVSSHFLMATTLKHELKCLPIKSLENADTSWSSEFVRCLERGSRLVMAVPHDTKTILQMPRGNLEVIHPRPVVIEVVKGHMENLDYGQAMELLRRHRINLNLLVDNNPEKFIANIDKFVCGVVDIHRLCVFIADLSNEEVTKTIYKAMFPVSCPKFENKVVRVCSALLTELEKDEGKFILPIMSCLVKVSDSKCTDAVLRVARLRGDNIQLAESALKFLALIVDVNVLFDEALGLYDFDLALLVAEHSQKDPKEYLPFLNEFKDLPIPFRYYKIDSHLKRFEKALVHLSQCKDLDIRDECTTLVVKQRLYSKALELFEGHENQELFSEICALYGNYLESKRYHDEAALMFDRGGLNKEAVESWERALDWQLCLGKAQEMGIPDHEITSLCERLEERLLEDNRYLDAAQIRIHYLNDKEQGISHLLDGGFWNESFRMIKQIKRDDLMETHFIPVLKKTAIRTLETIESKRTIFGESLARFEKVIDMKEKISAGFYDEVEVNVEDADLYSETASTIMSNISAKKSNPASLQTRQSHRSKSSKNRRKHEKKKYSTREGGTFEDLGLVSALHECMSSTIASTRETGELNRSLVLIKERKLAAQIQTQLSQLINHMKESVTTIWRPNDQSGEGHKFGPEATITEIIEKKQEIRYQIPYHTLDPHLRYPPTFGTEHWKLNLLN